MEYKYDELEKAVVQAEQKASTQKNEDLLKRAKDLGIDTETFKEQTKSKEESEKENQDSKKEAEEKRAKEAKDNQEQLSNAVSKAVSDALKKLGESSQAKKEDESKLYQ